MNLEPEWVILLISVIPILDSLLMLEKLELKLSV